MTLKAFYCRSELYEVSDIVFAENRNKAKWQFIKQWCEGEIGDQSVRRARQYDEYGAPGQIPVNELIFNHWWFECYGCDMRMDEDTFYEEGLDPSKAVGFFHGPVYCCPACETEQNDRNHRDSLIKGEIRQTMRWRLEDRFQQEMKPLGEDHIMVDFDGNVTYMCLHFEVDGVPITYAGSTTTAVPVEEWKRRKHTLTVPNGMADAFIEKFSLERLPNKSL